MKNIYAVRTVENKTVVETTTCMSKGKNITSFKFSISSSNINKVIKEGNELSYYTFDEKNLPSIRRQLLKEKKKLFKPVPKEE